MVFNLEFLYCRLLKNWENLVIDVVSKSLPITSNKHQKGET